MLHINESIESREYKIMNLFPVTTGHIPGSILIDSTVLSAIFKIKWKGLGDISDNHMNIWNTVFTMGHKYFRSFGGKENNPTAARQYEFAYMMQTDGVSASLIFRRKDLYEIPQQIIGPLGMVNNPLFVEEKIDAGPIGVGVIDAEVVEAVPLFEPLPFMIWDEEDESESDTDELVNATTATTATTTTTATTAATATAADDDACEAVDEALQLSYDVLCRLNHQLNIRVGVTGNRLDHVKVIDIIYDLGLG